MEKFSKAMVPCALPSCALTKRSMCYIIEKSFEFFHFVVKNDLNK